MEIFCIKTVGDRIKEKRIEIGMTRVEFAGLVGVDYRTLIRYECGLSIMNGRVLFQMAVVLGVKIDYLLGLKDD